MRKILTLLLNLALTMVSGAIAGAVFQRIWRTTARQDETPEARDPERTWTEILLAAAAQGALFAVVKAAIERGAVQGRRKLTATGED